MSHPACPRCYCEDDVLRPWPGFRIAKFVWCGVAALILMLSPILFSDLVVMIPMSMAFLFAGGPVFAHAALTPTCPACGLERPHPGWHETPCRPVRAVATWSLRVSASPARDDDEVSGTRTLPKG
ncbi:MAG TPA: hypothetical protein VFX59_30440 [Polyangiales bacterium]|nr:hypothetical protein [Polyangiales bacterium]